MDKHAECGADSERVEAWKLYLTGKTMRDGARVMGISKSNFHRHIKQTLDELAIERKALGNEYIESELERLDDLLDSWFAEKKKNDESDEPDISKSHTITENILKVMNRRARYLGLDAPEKKEITGSLSLADALTSTIKRD